MLTEEQKYVLDLISHQNIEKSSHYNLHKLDWGYIVKQCIQHRLAGVLYNKIKNLDYISEYSLSVLRNEYKIWEYIGNCQREEYLNVLQKLHNAGIKVILLKGVYLATKCYTNIAERPYYDMDILIKEEDVKLTFEIFKKEGYLQGEFNLETGCFQEFDSDRLLGYQRELQHYGEFVKKNNSSLWPFFSVDIHHRLNTEFDNFSYDIGELFERAVLDSISGVKFFRLCNEDFLLHLVSHLYWHTLSLRDIISGKDIILGMYYDIFLFIQHNRIAWDVLLKRASAYGLDRAIKYTFYHCRLLFGDVMPKEIHNMWNIVELKKISNTIYDRWFTRDILVPVGTWKLDFMDRIFCEDRKNEALLSFYNEYINKILFSGKYFKVVDINPEERFES